MSEVLSNETQQPNDFAYNVNNDGLHCGPQTEQDRSHLPASRVPVLLNTTSPPQDFPISLGGNLNNDGHLCGPPQPFVPPHPPTPTPPTPPCIPSSFPTQNTFGTLTIGSPDSPNRGAGFKSQLVTFQGTAGQSISIYYRSADVDCYMYLMDPTNVVVAQNDAAGWNLPGDVDNAALVITLASTGTFTVDCTTFSAGETGAFQLQVTVGQEEVLTLGNGCWAAVDVPSSKTFFVASGYGPGHGFANLYDGTSWALINSVDLGPTGAFLSAVIEMDCAFYNPNDNSIWIIVNSLGFFGWYRINPSTGALLETIPVNNAGLDGYVNMIYVPSRNRAYFVNTGATTWMFSYDCTSRTINLNAINFAPNNQDTINGLGYDPVNDNLIVNLPGVALYKVSPNDAILTPIGLPGGGQISASFIFPLVGRTMYGLKDGTLDGIRGINLDTLAVTNLPSMNTASFQGPWYNPCLKCWEVMQLWNDFFSGQQHWFYELVRLDFASGAFVELKIMQTEIPVPISNNQVSAFNTTASRSVFTFSANSTATP